MKLKATRATQRYLVHFTLRCQQRKLCVQTNLELFKTKTLYIFNFGTEDALYMLAIAMADQFLTTLQS